jgi:hypothetical protein
MYQDYKDLLSAFNTRGVRYLIVRAYAVIFHAQPRLFLGYPEVRRRSLEPRTDHSSIA